MKINNFNYSVGTGHLWSSESGITKPIYPEVLLNRYTDGILCATQIRREHEGKWYLKTVIREHGIGREKKFTDLELLDLLYEFTQDVYHAILLGSVDVNAVDRYGVPFYKLDAWQESEAERLSKKMFGYARSDKYGSQDGVRYEARNRD